MSERSETASNGTSDDVGAVRTESDASTPTPVCWICRQPLDPIDVVRWRGEPIHADCLIHGPRYLDDGSG